jgi:CRISPR-associated exonuclease Cas4
MVWDENLLTVEGRVMHENVDSTRTESRGDVKIQYGLPIRSLKLGLIGKADVVEFHKKGTMWLPYPVEYKHGGPKKNLCDKIQLCAQAICLEEMMSLEIKNGALFYGKIRKRIEVVFDDFLRNETEKMAKEVRALIENGVTPPAEYSPKCNQCSLFNLCLPSKSQKVLNYIKRMTENE